MSNRLVHIGALALIPLLIGTAAISAPSNKDSSTFDQESSANMSTDWKAQYDGGAAIMKRLRDTDFSLKENQGTVGMRRLEGHAKEAELCFRGALEQAQAQNINDEEISTILLRLGESLVWQKRYVEAKGVVRSAKGIREKHHAKQSLGVAECVWALVPIAQVEHNDALAEDLAIDVYDVYLKLLPRNDSRFCDVLPVLGGYTRDRKESAAYYGHYIEALEKRYGKMSAELRFPLCLYGAALANNHQHAESARTYQRAVGLYRLHPAKDKFDRAPTEQMESQQKIASGAASFHKCADDQPNQTGRRTNRLAGLVKSLGDTSTSTSSRAKFREKYGLFDNKSMDDMLQKAERLLASNKFDDAKVEWTRVLDFMHAPGWFPTAMMVPVSRRLASLAEDCLQLKQYADAESLMRGAFDFPFHTKEDETKIDAAAELLLKHLEKSDLRRCRAFLNYAIERVGDARKVKYKNWENSLPPLETCE